MTIRTFVTLFFFFIFQFYSFGQMQNPEKAIDSVLNAQVKAWNDGNLEEYMQGYWQSDSLVFIGKSGVTKGWQGTLDNYKKSYPDKKAMGKLSFEIISKEELGNEHYHVIGKWKLEREKDELKGHFSLIWKLINGNWLIIADHSS